MNTSVSNPRRLVPWDVVPGDLGSTGGPPPTSPAGVLRAAFAPYLYLDDPAVIDVALATVVANALDDGDPLWVLVVNPAGTAKTETVQAFRKVDTCAWLAEITENSFLSGLQRETVRGRRQPAPQNSLLFRWTDPKLRSGLPPVRVILVQDLTGLITAKRDKRDAIFGQLRQVFDGRLTKSTGMGEDLLWEGRLGMLGAVTEKYDRVVELHSVLGERFVLYRPTRTDPAAEARMAVRRSASSAEWRGAVADVARGTVQMGLDRMNAVTVPEPVTDRLIDLARLTALGRATVERDGYNKLMTGVAEPEGPARLAQ